MTQPETLASDPFSLAGRHPAATATDADPIRSLSAVELHARWAILGDAETSSDPFALAGDAEIITVSDDLVRLVPEMAALAGALPPRHDPAIIAWRAYTILQTAIDRSDYGSSRDVERKYDRLFDFVNETEKLFLATKATTRGGTRLQVLHHLCQDELEPAVIEGFERMCGDCVRPDETEAETLDARADAVLAMYEAQLPRPSAPDCCRRRAVALAAEYLDVELPEGDAGLVEAERQRAELTARRKELSREFADLRTAIDEIYAAAGIDRAEDDLWRFIHATAPTTVAGVVIKLRALHDEADAREQCSLAQCIEVLSGAAFAGAG